MNERNPFGAVRGGRVVVMPFGVSEEELKEKVESLFGSSLNASEKTEEGPQYSPYGSQVMAWTAVSYEVEAIQLTPGNTLDVIKFLYERNITFAVCRHGGIYFISEDDPAKLELSEWVVYRPLLGGDSPCKIYSNKDFIRSFGIKSSTSAAPPVHLYDEDDEDQD